MQETLFIHVEFLTQIMDFILACVDENFQLFHEKDIILMIWIRLNFPFNVNYI